MTCFLHCPHLFSPHPIFIFEWMHTLYLIPKTLIPWANPCSTLGFMFSSGVLDSQDILCVNTHFILLSWWTLFIQNKTQWSIFKLMQECLTTSNEDYHKWWLQARESKAKHIAPQKFWPKMCNMSSLTQPNLHTTNLVWSLLYCSVLNLLANRTGLKFWADSTGFAKQVKAVHRH